MKFIFFFCLFPIVASGQITEAPTKDSIAAKKAALNSAQKNSIVSAVKEEVVVKKGSSDNFMDTSSFLVGPLGYTLVQKGSAFCSGSFRLTQEKPTGLPYMKWSLFIRSNSAKFRMVAVHAKELKPGADLTSLSEQVKASRKVGITCVTTFNQQPIRILPVVETPNSQLSLN